MKVFYEDLAAWWHLISTPYEYAEEAAYFLAQFASITARPGASLLELGSGGGNNAMHMKHAFKEVTLSDLSQQMLDISQTINPDCEHIVGDMRHLRLGRSYDAVFIHDAIDYMTTHEDLLLAMQTAYVHCKPQGMVLIVPDYVAETFQDETDYGGEDDDDRGVRYLEWTYDPDPDDNSYLTDYVFVLHEDGQAPRIVPELHRLGLFPVADWLRLMKEAGFEAQVHKDLYGRRVFTGKRSA